MHLSVLWLSALFSLGASQTFSKCDPTIKSCPPNPGLPYRDYQINFSYGLDHLNWEHFAAGGYNYSHAGAGLTISKSGQSPTLQTKWYIFFGLIEVHLRAAPGQGIVSCIVLESDDGDEIDFEWLGGEPQRLQTNYFGKRNTTTWDRGRFSHVDDTQYVTHSYAIDWNQDSITWYVDWQPVRTLRFHEAVDGTNFPQTPARLRLGIWSGGDPKNPEGTISWSGGRTDYSKGPYTMYVERVRIVNYNPATSYVWGDKSGSWQSIQQVHGNRRVVRDMETQARILDSQADQSGQQSFVRAPGRRRAQAAARPEPSYRHMSGDGEASIH
ncbi:concanavalin A-like lectin/glucanase domain-containing protein [Echria macrotheca]|uniref:chitinase n=1 Tax=Echria macrotheca TaxID=438768 RepID=A0AAJ0B3J5_9PEZI|nr:concanavalin A-like lectin/glucanase domain-containing protein [Echria macrotheca]